jgi:PAS domain S-box-containing protein
MVLILVDVVLTFFMFLYGRAHRTYAGYTSWVISLPVLAVSLLFLQFTGTLPSIISVVLANVLLLLAYVLRCDGIWKFIHAKALDKRFYLAFILVTFCSMYYFTFIRDAVFFRALFRSVLFLLILIITIIPLITSKMQVDRTIRLAFAAVLLVLAAFYFVSLGDVYFSPAVSLTTVADPLQVAIYTYFVLADLMATALFILLNMSRFEGELQASNEQLAASEEEIRGQYELLAEQQLMLRDSEDKYRGVVTWASDGILMVQDGICIYLNPKVAELFGGKADELINKPFADFLSQSEREIVMDRYRRRMAGENVDSIFETVVVNKQNEPLDIEINAGIIMLDGKTTDLIFLRDIRERKKMQKALDRAKKKLSLLNKVTFNEIKTNIFTLSGYHTLLKQNHARDPAGPIDPLLEKENRILRQINDTLTFAQTYQDLGTRPAKWQNVRQVFLMAFSHVNTLEMKHEIQTGNLEIFADPFLEQVFRILADNVITHGKTATLLTMKYEIRPDESLVLFFEDNGAGIPIDQKERIFLPGPEISNIGELFLVREILEITEITIRESGEPEKGARFEIHVPKEAYRFCDH